jgi:hypothetical protein
MDIAILIALIAAAGGVIAVVLPLLLGKSRTNPEQVPMTQQVTVCPVIVVNTTAPHLMPGSVGVADPDSAANGRSTQRVTRGEIPNGDQPTAEEVMALFEQEGGWRGVTASPGNTYWEAACKLKFTPCRCGWSDESYRGHEYIARNSRGTCYYIGLNLKNKQITCGSKGYHHYRDSVPECV